MPLLNVSPYIELIATSITMEIISISQHEVEECLIAALSRLGMLRSTCCAAAASRNLHGTQRYLLKTT